jgi:ketosteroid isomerase-like protein
MDISPDYVRQIFKGLENGDGAAFFQHVSDDVDWIVMGTLILWPAIIIRKLTLSPARSPNSGRSFPKAPGYTLSTSW